jgi:hypothetical protein
MAQERLILDPTEPARTNQILNPSFETNTTSWGISTPSWTSSTFTRVANSFEGSAGSFVGRVQAVKDATATLRNGSISTNTPVGSVTPGKSYSSAFSMKALDAPVGGWTFRIDWYTAASAFISSSSTLSIPSAGSGAAARRVLEGQTAPANASFAQFVLLFTSSTSGDIVTFDVDAVLFEESATARQYFDGDTVPTVATYDVNWSSTAHGSVSVISPLRAEVDITPWIDVEGINWGDAEIEAYKAQAQVGESVIHYRFPNRNITVPLLIRDQGGTTFATARSLIQAKAALWMREGGFGKRILATGGTVYFDVASNGLTLSGDTVQAIRSVDDDAELRIEALPDFYEAEELVGQAEEASASELIMAIPDPGGDMPARVRIVVDEKQGVDQRGLIWAFRSRHYSSGSTAKTAYEAEELQLLDAARKVGLSGASGGTVVQHGTISTSWTPIVRGRIGGTAYPTHTGTNRVFARIYSTSGTLAQARLVWGMGGDLVHPVENAAYRVPGASNFYIADLGEARPDRPPVGPHRWDWQIQAKGDIGDEDFKVDKVWIVSADEGMGLLSAPTNQATSFYAYAARDEFNQVAGTLTGKALPIGGTWIGAGDASDSSVEAVGHTLQRSAVSDEGLGVHQGRLHIASAPTLAATVVEVDLKVNALGNNSLGLLARYASVANFLAVYLNVASSTLFVEKRVSSTSTILRAYPLLVFSTNTWYSLRTLVDTSGNVEVYFGPKGMSGALPLFNVTDSALATGGAIASGKVGIMDHAKSEGAMTRSFDNFLAWEPAADAVTFASQKAQLTTDGMFRHDAGGSSYGPISRVVGDLPRLPAGGLEGRAVELFLKGSRGDLGELPDSDVDDIGAKIFAKRSWLTVQGSI